MENKTGITPLHDRILIKTDYQEKPKEHEQQENGLYVPTEDKSSKTTGTIVEVSADMDQYVKNCKLKAGDYILHEKGAGSKVKGIGEGDEKYDVYLLIKEEHVLGVMKK